MCAEGEGQVCLHGCLAEFFPWAFFLSPEHMAWGWGLGVGLPDLKERVPGPRAEILKFYIWP